MPTLTATPWSASAPLCCVSQPGGCYPMWPPTELCVVSHLGNMGSDRCMLTPSIILTPHISFKPSPCTPPCRVCATTILIRCLVVNLIGRVSTILALHIAEA
eukprot:GGOE01046898.1.p1 GENE.GGOE01046898.1~~GGOE01046898.1.p1  ORF type:complete len:102 (-),score=4.45 GGOE01046898.1:329-634(-)